MTAVTAPARPQTRRHSWGRRLAVLLTATVVLGLAGTAAAGAAVHGRQQEQLAAAQNDRAAAVQALDAALVAAAADGVPASDLAGVRGQGAAILAEPAVAPRLHWFDNGEIDHLRAQAGRLRSQLGTIPAIEAAALDADRQRANASLDALERTLAAATVVGLDTTALAQTLARDRYAILAATSPLIVDAAVTDVPALTAALRQAIVARQAEIAAQAAAALASARADAQGALGRADGLLAQVTAFPKLQTGSDPQTIASAHHQMGLARTVGDFNAVSALLAPAIADLSGLLDARSAAYSAMAAARGVVSTAEQNSINASAFTQQLNALQPQLDGTGTAAGFGALTNQINAVVAPLQAEVARALYGTGKVIVISLADQALTAYDNGAIFVKTLVTTGRPALPTPPGSYSVLRRNSPWLMRSEYPPGTIGWYPPSWVSWVLWFRSDGYGIHDAPWRYYYGPGTQIYGSHGCVNVPHNAMARLYPWASIGTKVLVI